MLSLATLITTLAALGSAHGAAIINKRATRTITAASITVTGLSFPTEANVQPFSVDTAGYYRLYVRGGGGGLGGADTTRVSGKGAIVSGTYVLLPGQTYLAVVGQRGGTGTGTTEISAGGGGGGSFVYQSDNTVLVAAGGGGGNSYNGAQTGRDALSTSVSGNGQGGTASAGAGAGGAGFGTADETGQTGDGQNAGIVQGAKGGKTKNTWAGGAVDSRQTGAQGKGGFGGGGGGGKYSGGGGGGFTGGNGGPLSGNIGRPVSPGSGGTSFVRAANYNGFPAVGVSYGAASGVGDGQVSIKFVSAVTTGTSA